MSACATIVHKRIHVCVLSLFCVLRVGGSGAGSTGRDRTATEDCSRDSRTHQGLQLYCHTKCVVRH